MNQSIPEISATKLPSFARTWRERPALVLGIAMGVGALLGGVLARRDRGLFLDLVHLAARIALATGKT